MEKCCTCLRPLHLYFPDTPRIFNGSAIRKGRHSCSQARSHGGASGYNAPTTNLDVPTINLNSTRYQQADQPAKHVAHRTAAKRCLCWPDAVRRGSFSKLWVYMQDVFVQCCRAHCVTKVLILWPWQRRFVRLCIHKMHTYVSQSITYVCTLTGTRTEQRCNHCVHGLATVLLLTMGNMHNSGRRKPIEISAFPKRYCSIQSETVFEI